MKAMLVVLAFALGCDTKATTAEPQAVARPEQKSKEYESCGTSSHCGENLRCFQQTCRRTARSVVGDYFAAVGTAGQRCTSLRRLIVHEDVAGPLLERLADAYRSVPIGDPREEGTLVGPLVTGEAFGRLEAALGEAVADGGQILVGGGRAHADRWPEAWYAEPTIVRIQPTERVACPCCHQPIRDGLAKVRGGRTWHWSHSICGPKCEAT